MKLKISNQGFTLVELLVAMIIAGVVAAGIYSTFYSQQKSYLAQEQIAAMQQNLRGAMHGDDRHSDGSSQFHQVHKGHH
jgi:prepilin-type N-terminal cleavage/methylation domain-containing protein